MGAKLVFYGIDELMIDFEEIEGLANNTLIDKAIDAGAEELIPAIKRRAPKDTIHRGINKTERGRTVNGKKVVKDSRWRGSYHMADTIGQSGKRGKNGERHSYVGPDKGRFIRDNKTRHFYWRFHEFGTTKMPAKPFMGPAFDETQEKIYEAMESTLLEGLGIE